jgi:hypothetical protein
VPELIPDALFSIGDGLDPLRVAVAAVSLAASVAYFGFLQLGMSPVRTGAKTVVFAVLAILPLLYLPGHPERQLALFLRRVHHGLNLQEAIDLPLFHTQHFPSSFYPRGSRPGHLMVEETVGEATLTELRRRGHDLEVAGAWTVGRLTAAEKDADGILHAAATPRLMQAYAIGR